MQLLALNVQHSLKFEVLIKCCVRGLHRSFRNSIGCFFREQRKVFGESIKKLCLLPEFPSFLIVSRWFTKQVHTVDEAEIPQEENYQQQKLDCCNCQVSYQCTCPCNSTLREKSTSTTLNVPRPYNGKLSIYHVLLEKNAIQRKRDLRKQIVLRCKRSIRVHPR